MRQKQTPKSCISAGYFVLRSSKARGNLERNVKRLSARRAHPSDRQSRCRQKRLVRQIIANVAHWTRVHSTASRHYRANIDFVPVHSQRCLGVGGELINQLYFQISQFSDSFGRIRPSSERYAKVVPWSSMRQIKHHSKWSSFWRDWLKMEKCCFPTVEEL